MKSDGFRAFVEELFEPVEGSSVRAMFGGLGIFREGIMFALAADEVLYFRGDSETEPAFRSEGCEAWVYPGKNRPMTMPYWRVPERLYEDRDEFRAWALAAFAAAERNKAGKKKPAAKKAKPTPKVVAAKPGPTRKSAARPRTGKLR